MAIQNTLPRYSSPEKNQHLWQNEKMEWRDSPDFKFRFTMFEDDGKNEYSFGLQSILGGVSAIVVILLYMFYVTENWLGFISTLFIGVFIIILPDILKHIRKRNTEYAFNEEGVFFQIVELGHYQNLFY